MKCTSVRNCGQTFLLGQSPQCCRFAALPGLAGAAHPRPAASNLAKAQCTAPPAVAAAPAWAAGCGQRVDSPAAQAPAPLQGDRNDAAPDADAFPFQPELPGVALPGKQPVDLGLLQGQGRIARYGVQNTALLYRYLFRVPPENRQKSRLCMLIQPGCGGVLRPLFVPSEHPAGRPVRQGGLSLLLRKAVLRLCGRSRAAAPAARTLLIMVLPL